METSRQVVEDISVCTFNCKNAKTSQDEIAELCSSHDVILLQETWLLDFELPLLATLNSQFYASGVSSMNSSSRLWSGRPFGGLAVLWHKRIGSVCNIVKYDDDPRLLGINININGNDVLILNVYLPCDNAENENDFICYLAKISSIVTSHPTGSVMVMGDFNANLLPNVGRRFGDILLNFCEDESLIISDYVALNNSDPYTFYSEAHGSVSWLDHVVTTKNVHKSIENVHILKSYVSSDHLPVSVALKVDSFTPVKVESAVKGVTIQWSELSEQDIEKYRATTSEALGNLHLDQETLFCSNINCKSADHCKSINVMYDNLIDVLNEAAVHLALPKRRFKQVPGWNDYCRETHCAAREAFLLWQANRKPRQGVFFDNMKRTRAQFKASLRYCKSIESKARADAIARKFMLKDTKSFWKEIKNINSDGCSVLPSSVGKVSGDQNICHMWKDHYESLLNSNNDVSCKSYVLKSLSTLSIQDNWSFNVEDICSAINKLKSGKSAGVDGIQSEHLKYCDEKINLYFCNLFNCMLKHGFLPDTFMKTIIVPIIKDKRGDVTDKDNYRPIALTTIASKLLEILLFQAMEEKLYTCDNQFGFKTGHSTDMCIFAFKQIMEYYTSFSSPVYICYMDASKAFDRLNHWRLFNCLIERKVPLILIRLLCFWYSTQQLMVRWGNSLSLSFSVTNGVRQGGVISPHLFNLYMDKLSQVLIQSDIGCKLNGKVLNHFMYADDAVICAPSPTALQCLLNICEEFAQEFSIKYNLKKTVCMSIKPKIYRNNLYVPSFTLCGHTLKFVDKYNYLGAVISSDCTDDKDLLRQLRGIYARGNMLVKRFGSCTDEVKIQLFKSYCSNLYAAHLWCNYKKRSHEKIRVAFNNVVRSLMGIKRGDSISLFFVNNNFDSFAMILRKCIFNFRNRVLESKNLTIDVIVNSRYFYTCSITKRWTELLYCIS